MKVKHSPLYYVYQVFNTVFLALVSLTCILPILHVFAMSLSDSNAALAGRVTFWPVQFSLSAYEYLIQKKDFFHSVSISAWRVLIGTLINMVLIVLTAYPLSRPATHFKARKWYMLYFSITMFIGGGLIPTYMVVSKLHLTDTIWAMVIPSAMGVWNVILVKTYIQSSIPDEILESAALDGCSDWKYFIHMVIPLSKPIIAVMTLLYAVGRWNDFFSGLIYLNRAELQPLQLILRNILVQGDSMGMALSLGEQMNKQEIKTLLQYALIVVSSVPVLILYPFIQKYFVKGIMMGSIKG